MNIKDKCMSWLEEIWVDAPVDVQEGFIKLKEEDLIEFHHTLCRDMRNENDLWVHRETIGHPDDFSMSVLTDFWRTKNGL